MIEDREFFKVEKEEMAMMRKAYIQEKTGIQKMSDAFQVEKEKIEKERKAFNKEFRGKCKRIKVLELKQMLCVRIGRCLRCKRRRWKR